jgi:hypothetical protein
MTTSDASGTTAPIDEPTPCQIETTQITPIPPDLLFVLDKSGSMSMEQWDHDDNPQTPNVTRWYSLHGVVKSIVTTFNKTVNFGVKLFPKIDAGSYVDKGACDRRPGGRGGDRADERDRRARGHPRSTSRWRRHADRDRPEGGLHVPAGARPGQAALRPADRRRRDQQDLPRRGDLRGHRRGRRPPTRWASHLRGGHRRRPVDQRPARPRWPRPAASPTPTTGSSFYRGRPTRSSSRPRSSRSSTTR